LRGSEAREDNMQISFARTPQLTWHQPQPLAAVLRPPRQPRRAGGLSGRPSCRIYRGRQAWVLEFDSVTGGWIEPARVPGDDNGRLTFATLSAAIAYAERHGLDYRIVPPPRHQMASNGNTATTLPRSWRARLSRNGWNGDIYHG
jgi:hypothetical protein